MLAAHCRQFPLRHTRSTPHASPEGAAGPSTHTAEPEAQRTTPCTQGLLGLPEQIAPSLQVMHWPAVVHTRPTPQGLPAGFCRVVSTQPASLPQTVSPSRQGSAFDEQVTPSVQVTQLPLRQMRLFPHATPDTAGPSMQLGVPAWQNVTPLRHGAPVLPAQGWLF